MSMPAYTTLSEHYRACENECLKAWRDSSETRPMTASDQAIIVGLASRLLYNIRLSFRDTHGMGGMGAIEATMKTLKYLKLSPQEYVAKLTQQDGQS